MTDGSDLPPEALLIDARSPAERWADAGRVGAERVRVFVRESPVGTVTLVLLGALVVIIASEVYSALAFSSLSGFDTGGGNGWLKVQLLASTGGLGIAAVTLIGLGLAVLADGWQNRVAYRLGLVLGVWIMVAGGCGLASAIHSSSPGPGFPSENRVVTSLPALADIAIGLVVAAIAWWLASSDLGGRAAVDAGDMDDDDDDDNDDDDDLEIVELS